MAGTRVRSTVRAAIATDLTTDLVGAGKPLTALYDYIKGSFGGLSPVMVIGSAGSDSEPMTFSGSKITYFFDLMTFVLRGTESGDYTEENADDQLDLVADALEAWVAANRSSTGVWDALNYNDRSTVIPVTVGGDPYWMELVTLEVGIF